MNPNENIMKLFTLEILLRALSHWQTIDYVGEPKYSGLCSYFDGQEGIDYEITVNVLVENGIMDKDSTDGWIAEPGEPKPRIKALKKLIKAKKEEQK